jgi:hypothetical protein
MQRELRNQPPNLAPPVQPPLLVSRREAARLLSCDVSTIRRLERDGELTPIRLNKRSKWGRVYFENEEILALVRSRRG